MASGKMFSRYPGGEMGVQLSPIWRSKKVPEKIIFRKSNRKFRCDPKGGRYDARHEAIATRSRATGARGCHCWFGLRQRGQFGLRFADSNNFDYECLSVSESDDGCIRARLYCTFV